MVSRRMMSKLFKCSTKLQHRISQFNVCFIHCEIWYEKKTHTHFWGERIFEIIIPFATKLEHVHPTPLRKTLRNTEFDIYFKRVWRLLVVRSGSMAFPTLMNFKWRFSVIHILFFVQWIFGFYIHCRGEFDRWIAE